MDARGGPAHGGPNKPEPHRAEGELSMAETAAITARDCYATCRTWIETLFPGYFALVMATGIIANAMWFEGHRGISNVLLVVNVVAFVVLLAMTLLRGLVFFRALWRDLTDPKLVFAFFTLVAATDVLGVGLGLRGYGSVALVMWFAALGLWLALTYLGFTVLILGNGTERTDIIFGGWLIAIVATEAVALHGVFVAPYFGASAAQLVLFSHMLWGVGVVLYAIFIVLFAHRVFFAPVKPEHLTPILWVVMGAAAISTNAGAVLIVTDVAQPFLTAMRPFVEGATLVMWAWATWWIPLLVAFGIWTHIVHRQPLTYTPLFWSLVFPLGMYALASLRLAQAADIGALAALSRVMVWIALAAWSLTAVGLVVTLWRHWQRGEGGASGCVPRRATGVVKLP
ncbi:putative C4-dicarboxylate transporter/malic acid transport protein [Afipia carboxidovorans OM5]|nr:putative C4-dicarboxylate transporter/malic acid transport protein [Afipia carboxidovorans OM5]